MSTPVKPVRMDSTSTGTVRLMPQREECPREGIVEIMINAGGSRVTGFDDRRGLLKRFFISPIQNLQAKPAVR